MKILLAVHQFFPRFSLGTERYTLALAQELQRLGDEVVVLTVDASGDPAEQTEAVREYEWEGVRVLAIATAASPIRRLAEYHTRPEWETLYDDLLLRERPDLVHCCHLMQLGVELLYSCRDMKVPVTATLTDLWGLCWAGQLVKPCDQTLCAGPSADASNCIHDFLSIKRRRDRFESALERGLAKVPFTAMQLALIKSSKLLPQGVRQRWLPDFHDLGCRNGVIRAAFADFREVVFPSRFLQEECEAHGLVKAGMGTLLPYGIRSPDEQEWESLRAPKKEGVVTFAFIGQLAKHKGLNILLEAFGRLNRGGVRLVIHGKPNRGDPNAKEIMEMIANTEGVEYAGAFNGDQIYQILSGVDAVVIPSIWHENAPLTMLEALSAGRPVLVSRARGMVDFIEEGRTGLIFEMRSVDSLEQVLRRFLMVGAEMREKSIENPGFQWTPADHASALRNLILPHRRGSEVWQMPINKESLHGLLRMKVIVTPLTTISTDSLAGALVRSRVSRCELRLPFPSANGMAPNRSPGDSAASLENDVAKSRNSLVGSTFPKLKPGQCLVRTHSKPHVSLWGEKQQTVQLLKVPGARDADVFRICARPKNGMRTRIQVTGRRESGGKSITLSQEWNWTAKGWTEFELDLAGLRKRLPVLERVDWIPVLTKDRWKIDFAEFTPVSCGHTK